MPGRDGEAPDAAAPRSRLHNGIQVGAIVHGRINDQRAMGTTAKHNRIGARPRHNRGVRGEDDCVWLWHQYPPNKRLQMLQALQTWLEIAQRLWDKRPHPCNLVICSGTSQVLAASSCRKTRVLPFSWINTGMRAGTCCTAAVSRASFTLPNAASSRHW